MCFVRTSAVQGSSNIIEIGCVECCAVVRLVRGSIITRRVEVSVRHRDSGTLVNCAILDECFKKIRCSMFARQCRFANSAVVGVTTELLNRSRHLGIDVCGNNRSNDIANSSLLSPHQCETSTHHRDSTDTRLHAAPAAVVLCVWRESTIIEVHRISRIEKQELHIVFNAEARAPKKRVSGPLKRSARHGASNHTYAGHEKAFSKGEPTFPNKFYIIASHSNSHSHAIFRTLVASTLACDPRRRHCSSSTFCLSATEL